jgi:hypothetical protein
MQGEGQNTRTRLNFILQLPVTLCTLVFLATNLWAAPLSCCISIELDNSLLSNSIGSARTNANFMHHLMVFHAPVRLKGGGGRGGLFYLCVSLSCSRSLSLAYVYNFSLCIVLVFIFLPQGNLEVDRSAERGEGEAPPTTGHIRQVTVQLHGP